MCRTRAVSSFVLLALSALGVWAAPAWGAIKLTPPPLGVYHSAHPDFGVRDDNVTDAGIEAFTRLAGKDIVWAYLSFHWDQGIVFPTEACRTLYARGIVPLVGIMPWSTMRQSCAEPIYTMARILNGEFDQELLQCAEDVRMLGFPIMVEFGPEVNGSWFPWNGAWNGRDAETYGGPGPDGPERFRDAYRHIVDLFRAAGADNVTWVFHAAGESVPKESWNAAANYYPGDDYVDWLGASLYGRLRGSGAAKSFEEKMDELYAELTALSPRRPIALLEMGVSDAMEQDDKAEWIRGALDGIRTGRYPRLKAVSWWNKAFRPDGTRSTLEIDSSSRSLEAYREGVVDMVDIPWFAVE